MKMEMFTLNMSKKSKENKSEAVLIISELLNRSTDPLTDREIKELRSLMSGLSEEEAIELVENQIASMQDVRLKVIYHYLNLLKKHVNNLKLEILSKEVEDSIIYLSTVIKECCDKNSIIEKEIIDEMNNLISSIKERSGKTIH